MTVLKWQRASKALLAFMIGCFALLVALDNILDFKTNLQFVQHVMRMYSMQPWFNQASALQTRATSNTAAHYATYIAIISCEILSGLSYLLSSCYFILAQWKRKWVVRGKIWFLAASMLGLIVWYFGFCVIAGEYFSMWANTYNAYEKAYLLSIFTVLATLFVCQKEYRL